MQETEAIADKKFQPVLSGGVAADSSATIKQTAFDNENVKYESNSNAAARSGVQRDLL